MNFTDVDMDALKRDILKINPKIEIFEAAARTGLGIREWTDWLVERVNKKKL